MEEVIYIFIAGFILLLNINNPRSLFFIGTIFIIIYVYYKNNLQKVKTKDQTISKIVNDTDRYEIPEDKIFSIHKIPQNLKFIQSSAEFKSILYDLNFLRRYDDNSYEKIVAYLEYFLRLHYRMMMGKYSFNSYFPILLDIRNELLNTLKAAYYNIPRNWDNTLEVNIIKIRGKTSRMIRTLHHKYGGGTHLNYEAPFGYDSMKDDRYHMF